MLAFFVVSTILSNLTLTLTYYYVVPANIFGPVMPSSFGPAAGALAMLAWAVFLSPQRVATYLFVPMPMWTVGALVLIFDMFFFMQLQPLVVKMAAHVLSLSFAFS